MVQAPVSRPIYACRPKFGAWPFSAGETRIFPRTLTGPETKLDGRSGAEQAQTQWPGKKAESCAKNKIDSASQKPQPPSNFSISVALPQHRTLIHSRLMRPSAPQPKNLTRSSCLKSSPNQPLAPWRRRDPRVNFVLTSPQPVPTRGQACKIPC